MSSAHIMNVSQTNNSLLKNRLNQLSLELATLKSKYAELEKNANHDNETVNDYAKTFTTNTTSNEKFTLNNELEENPLWETQIKTVKNISLQVANDRAETKIVITLSEPFTYITDNSVHRISELFIQCHVEEHETSINGVSQFQGSSRIIPFNSTTIFASKKQTTDDITTYSIGETNNIPHIVFESSDAPTFKASISSSSFTVKP